MPVKTKKKPTASRPRSTVTKSNRILSTSVNKKRVLIVIAVLAVLGAFLMFRASAATTNFEAEAGTKSNEVTLGTDASGTTDPSSGGKYATFASAAPGTVSSTQRFPGDPNPKVSSKAYWGADQLEGTTYQSRFETPTGTSMSTVRRFWSSWTQRGNLAGQAKTDLAANRMPMYSIKPVGWKEMASGTRDKEIDDFLRSLDSAGGPVWLIIHHEPDGGGAKVGPKAEDDAGGAPAWVAMQKKFRSRMTAVGTKNVALMAAMTGGFGGDLHQPKDNWWADGVFDAFLLDHYMTDLDKPVSEHSYWKGFSSWADQKKIPYGTAELGIRYDAEGVGYYKPTSDCNNLVPRGVSATLDQLAGDRLKEFWGWGFANKKDVIAHAYFDKCVNSGDSPYALGGKQLETFRNILKSDGRVQRVNGLKAGTTAVPTTYGTITSSVNLPENGTYKLWVRLSAPDGTNNAVQAQIDNGAIVKMGDSAITANKWTWVDYANGDANSQATFSLSSGTRKITLTGIEKGVKVDRILLTNETCTPTGKGDNCAIATPPPPPPPVSPSVTISGISNGQTISGTVKVSVTSSNPINSVAFRPDNVWAATESLAPFEYNWDTTKYSNGTHTMVTRTRTPEYTGDTYASNTVTVTIKNTTSASAPVPIVSDTIAPSKPTSLRAALVFDWSKLKYVMNLDWDASYDNVGVTGYQVTRGTKVLGTSKTSDYVDATNLSGGATYTYSVVASDAVGQKSPAASITLTTECILLSCKASVK